MTERDKVRRRRRNQIKGIFLAIGRRYPCPVCGGAARPAGASWMHAYLRCAACDLLYVAQLPAAGDLEASYERVHQSDYQVEHKRDWPPWMEHKRVTLAALGITPAALPPGEHRALDVGCGEGRLMLVLQDIGWDTRGLELNGHLASQARGLGLDVIHGSVDRAAPGGPYQLVLMNHLIEHLRTPMDTLARVRGWLAPGGRLVVETPLNPDLDNIDHLCCFSAAALSVALDRSGFAPLSWFDYVDDNYRHHNLACCARVR